MSVSAREYAVKLHADQMYGDKPYSFHLEQVALTVIRDNYFRSANTLNILVDVAYLHDVMEDCGVSYHDLADLFGVVVAGAVDLLTKKDGVPYGKYIEGIKRNFYAKVVKIADTKANLKQSVLDNDRNRIVKYAKQLILLED